MGLDTQGWGNSSILGHKNGKRGFHLPRGAVLHQVKGSVHEWVGAMEVLPDAGISCMGHWKEKGANGSLVEALEAENRRNPEQE